MLIEQKFFTMAEYVASPSCIELNILTSPAKQKACAPQNSLLRTFHRKYSCGRKAVQLSTWKACTSGMSNLKAIPCLKETPLECRCLGSLVDPDGATASDWISVSDQLLLMASILLTYMAGVIPIKKFNLSSQKNAYDSGVVSESSTSSGSAKRNDDHVNSKYTWDALKTKLLDSLDAVELWSNFRDEVLELEQQRAKQPLSLYAVSEGPKLRLLWASFQQLQEEVNNVFGDFEAVNLDEWLAIFPEIVQKSCHAVCTAWLVEELGLENKSDKALISLMIEKLKSDDTILQNIRKSGKGDLYAELLYFLRFCSLRKNSCYDHSLFILHGDSILEDLVISLADGIASVYLELISVDGNLSNEMNGQGMVLCNLSNRALQRLRNEVALNQWLYQNVESVVSMYEDRFDLRILQLKVIEQLSQNKAENHGWWNKLTGRKTGTMSSSLYYIVISQFSLPVKRTQELRALSGWRYYFSLYLELSDISMPLIKAVIEKIRNAISFFLVSLIGRSLGLIFTGIRQSLRWK